MSEHLSNQSEKSRGEHESGRPEHDKPAVETQKAAESLDYIETADARRQVERESQKTERASSGEQPKPSDRHRVTNLDKARAYQQTIRAVQSNLPPLSRGFSKFMHQRGVERASELAEKTLARPSALLGAGLFATIGLGIMLYFARRNGFALSGSELILFVVVGWALGLASEFVAAKLLRRR